MKGQVADDAQLLKQQNLGSLDARAAAAGMSGSSGYRDQVSDMMESVDESALNQMSQIGLNAHDQGIQQQIQLASQMDQNQQFGTSNLQNLQQGAMNQFNPAMVGQNMAGQYAQTIGGPTVLGNSSSNSSGSSFNNSSSANNSSSTNNANSNNFGANMGFSNGMNIGMNQAGGFNNAFGSGASNGTGSSSSWNLDGAGAAAAAGAFSDVRLKENIEHVDQVNGVNLYTWDWKDDAPVTSPMNYGVIAQEVAETHPEAVMTGAHGYMMVDYNKLGRAGRLALARVGE